MGFCISLVSPSPILQLPSLYNNNGLTGEKDIKKEEAFYVVTESKGFQYDISCFKAKDNGKSPRSLKKDR
jgi:hypothetical protein